MSSPYLGDPSPVYREFPSQETSYQEPSYPERPSQQPSSPQPASQPSRYHQPPFGGFMIQPVMVYPRVNGPAIASMVLGLWFVLIGFAVLGWRSAFFFTTSRLELLGLGVVVLGVGIAAVILGHIALQQMSTSNGVQRGRRMAITGLTLGYLAIAAVIAAFAVVLLRPGLLPPQ